MLIVVGDTANNRRALHMLASMTLFRTDGGTLSNGLEDGFICEIIPERSVKLALHNRKCVF